MTSPDSQTRRQSLGWVLAGAAAAGAFLASPVPARAGFHPATRDSRRRLVFAGERRQVVDFGSFVSSPVILERIEVVSLSRNSEFLRVTSRDGATGVVKANSRMAEVMSLLDMVVAPRFLGEDVRQLEAIIDDLYRREYKFAGLALWTAVGHLELAIWDMLGKAAGVPCARFIGPQLRDRIPVYLSSLDRNSTPEAEVAFLQERLAATGARAVKIKVGGRMSRNRDASPGRQEALVQLARRALGDGVTIYADANGSFDAPTAIRLCQVLEDNGIDILEEPCPFEDFEMTAQVADHVRRRRMRLKIAGGEQDGAMERWRWYLENRALHVLQPDFMYNGGMSRTVKVARMAEAAGVPVAPHYPRNGVETVELLAFASVTPNLYGFQEYRARLRTLDFEHSPVLDPVDGMLPVPDGPGFGASYDPDIFTRGRRMNSVERAP
jgi:L-alanine-DL-glutamate epimerase-like enolase superfamily enzyme